MALELRAQPEIVLPRLERSVEERLERRRCRREPQRTGGSELGSTRDVCCCSDQAAYPREARVVRSEVRRGFQELALDAHDVEPGALPRGLAAPENSDNLLELANGPFEHRTSLLHLEEAV